MNINPIRRCSDCTNMTRPSRTLLAEYPGTTQRNGERCIACYKRAKNALPDPVSRPSHEYNLAGLASFLRRRHERANMMARRDYYQQRISA